MNQESGIKTKSQESRQKTRPIYCAAFQTCSAAALSPLERAGREVGTEIQELRTKKQELRHSCLN